jgi:hypothetical protein
MRAWRLTPEHARANSPLLTQKLRQLGDVRRNPSRLIFGE